MNVKRWLVYSPQYQTTPMSWSDPGEYGCDAVEVETDSKRDALMLGVAEMLRGNRSYALDNRDAGLPPWAGIKVEASCGCACHDGLECEGLEAGCDCRLPSDPEERR